MAIHLLCNPAPPVRKVQPGPQAQQVQVAGLLAPLVIPALKAWQVMMALPGQLARKALMV